MSGNVATQPRADGEVVTGQVHVHDVATVPDVLTPHQQRVSETMGEAGAVAVTAYMQAYMN